MDDLMAMRRRILLSTPHKATASGSNLQLLFAASKVESLIIGFNATQSGSGNPSPSNVRPITGVDSAVTNLGSKTATVSLGATYGGGHIDYMTGALTASRAYRVVTKWNATISSIAAGTNSIRLWFYVGGVRFYNGNAIMSYLTKDNNMYNVDTPGYFGAMSGWPDSFWLRLPYGGTSGVQAATDTAIKDYLYVHPLELVSDLMTPTSTTVTPVSQVLAPYGLQTVSVPNGTVDSITYWTH